MRFALHCCAPLLVAQLLCIADAYRLILTQASTFYQCGRSGDPGRRDLHDEAAWAVVRSVASHKFTLSLYSALDDDQGTSIEGFTQKQLLKEETEAPFRTVRIYVYIALLSAAGLGSLVGLTKLIAIGASGRSEYEDMNDLYTNLAVNLGGLPVLGWLWKRGTLRVSSPSRNRMMIVPCIHNTDLDSRRSILDRIQKGGSLAALKVKLLINSEPVAVKLADLRRDRGIEKRVVIVAAERELLRSSLQSSIERSASLLDNDLLIVPIVIERDSEAGRPLDYSLAAPNVEALLGFQRALDPKSPGPVDHIAVPLAISSWNEVLKREFQSALKQQPDALLKGIDVGPCCPIGRQVTD